MTIAICVISVVQSGILGGILIHHAFKNHPDNPEPIPQAIETIDSDTIGLV